MIRATKIWWATKVAACKAKIEALKAGCKRLAIQVGVAAATVVAGFGIASGLPPIFGLATKPQRATPAVEAAWPTGEAFADEGAAVVLPGAQAACFRVREIRLPLVAATRPRAKTPAPPTPPPLAEADPLVPKRLCRDGTFGIALHPQSTCTGHGGVWETANGAEPAIQTPVAAPGVDQQDVATGTVRRGESIKSASIRRQRALTGHGGTLAWPDAGRAKPLAAPPLVATRISEAVAQVATGAIACGDGTTSASGHRQGACASHGGILASQNAESTKPSAATRPAAISGSEAVLRGDTHSETRDAPATARVEPAAARPAHIPNRSELTQPGAQGRITCGDGSTSTSPNRRGACSHHGGIQGTWDTARPKSSVEKPVAAVSRAGPTDPGARGTIGCGDGTTSPSSDGRGACSHHGGIRDASKAMGAAPSAAKPVAAISRAEPTDSGAHGRIICGDGSTSTSPNRRGACSHHGGISEARTH